MNPLQALLLKWAAKIAEALFKKQYAVSKQKVEEADASKKTDAPVVADQPDSGRL